MHIHGNIPELRPLRGVGNRNTPKATSTLSLVSKYLSALKETRTPWAKQQIETGAEKWEDEPGTICAQRTMGSHKVTEALKGPPLAQSEVT